MEGSGWGLVFIVPLIVGLVELAHQAGLGSLSSAALAIGLGLAVRLGYQFAAGPSEPRAWADALVQGLTIGLVAAGLAAKIRRVTEERP